LLVSMRGWTALMAEALAARPGLASSPKISKPNQYSSDNISKPNQSSSDKWIS